MGPINSCHYRGERPRLEALHLSCLTLGHPEAGALILAQEALFLFSFISCHPHTACPQNLQGILTSITVHGSNHQAYLDNGTREAAAKARKPFCCDQHHPTMTSLPLQTQRLLLSKSGQG